ncbi:MAG: hypothetical protein A2514_11725 [Gammaproteobacteria bacterium RIFOXYD12_FULL_61_37]|nr:MAG: hypothetical protein A2514_11725 [Gammaproteobacteria bacterium RIFOXYD12_FULL_61_37]
MLTLPAQAGEGLLQPGDAVVSGFSGIRPADRPVPPGANPLDSFYIDTEGPAAQILSLSGLGGEPAGQLVTPPIKRQIKAGEVGQVFAISLDDGQGSGTANIYLGATSAYGIQIVGPDADGDGLPNRLRTGQPGAQFMAGQFGPGGDPGTIWRVDGVTGAVAAFATLPGNSGPGIGDVVFDRGSRLFYVSDLETGLIHRLDSNGAVLDSFDHGINGRPARGLAPVPDDGVRMDIANPTFDSENPATWGYTHPDRRVQGMTVQNGRLYYAVAGNRQVWSVGLNGDGSFTGDARWELDASGMAGDGPITDMLFDAQGRLHLAQRGAPRGSYNYAVFAEPGRSTVLRYRPEQPDDPATESRWVVDPESYAVGLTPPHNNANGGIALGNSLGGAAGAVLWSTGERLRPSEDADPAAPADVHGLQGNGADLVRPANEPPAQSYFIDYDGLFNDPEKAGHMGDVEIVPGEPVQTGQAGYVIPWETLPPYDIPPGDRPGYDLNLRLTKRTIWHNCIDGGVNWVCGYEVRVRNTSDAFPFFGLIRVRDHLPVVPPGAMIQVPEAPAPWLCGWVAAPNTFACQRNAFLPPLASVAFHVIVRIPKASAEAAHLCHLSNIAEIAFPVGGSWRNFDPFDDMDAATAVIPAPYCNPPMQQTNLRIEKVADPGNCGITSVGFLCRFRIRVWNAGPGVFNHELTIQDTLPAGVIPVFSPGWNCGPGINCTHLLNPLHLAPGEERFLWVSIQVPRAVALANHCQIRNQVRILTPPGGHPMNTNPADDQAEAVALIPGNLCTQILPIQKQECPPGYRLQGGQCARAPSSDPTPPPTPECPPRTRGKWPNCSPNVPPANPCPDGTYGTPPNCVTDPPRCPDGQGRWPNCQRHCPEGSVGTPPNCHCPDGMVGTPPYCTRINVDPGFCPPGKIRRGKTCITAPVLPVCPSGSAGKWPNCRCPSGMTGKWPNCTRKPGSITPPVTPPVTPESGPKCPKGTRGTPPHCVRIIVDPRPCPTGTIGRWPNCKRIVLERPCPAGTLGQWPRCRPIRVTPPVTRPPSVTAPLRTIQPGITRLNTENNLK